MDSVPPPIYAAIGAVLAALIAGAFSYFNLVASKEIKISEFRQSWINALREEISTYISRVTTGHILQIRLDPTVVDPKAKTDLTLERTRMLEEANYSYHAIHLRINKHETNPVAKEINEKFISALEAIHSQKSGQNIESVDQRIAKLSSTAAAVLKFEWNRVRDGEPTYKRAKLYALITMFVALLLLGGIVGLSVSSPAREIPTKSKAQVVSPSPSPALPATKASMLR